MVRICPDGYTWDITQNKCVKLGSNLPDKSQFSVPPLPSNGEEEETPTEEPTCPGEWVYDSETGLCYPPLSDTEPDEGATKQSTCAGTIIVTIVLTILTAGAFFIGMVM